MYQYLVYIYVYIYIYCLSLIMFICLYFKTESCQTNRIAFYNGHVASWDFSERRKPKQVATSNVVSSNHLFFSFQGV